MPPLSCLPIIRRQPHLAHHHDGVEPLSGQEANPPSVFDFVAVHRGRQPCARVGAGRQVQKGDGVHACERFDVVWLIVKKGLVGFRPPLVGFALTGEQPDMVGGVFKRFLDVLAHPFERVPLRAGFADMAVVGPDDQFFPRIDFLHEPGQVVGHQAIAPGRGIFGVPIQRHAFP